jgi:hypothetical protein
VTSHKPLDDTDIHVNAVKQYQAACCADSLTAIWHRAAALKSKRHQTKAKGAISGAFVLPELTFSKWLFATAGSSAQQPDQVTARV